MASSVVRSFGLKIAAARVRKRDGVGCEANRREDKTTMKNERREVSAQSFYRAFIDGFKKSCC